MANIDNNDVEKQSVANGELGASNDASGTTCSSSAKDTEVENSKNDEKSSPNEISETPLEKAAPLDSSIRTDLLAAAADDVTSADSEVSEIMLAGATSSVDEQEPETGDDFAAGVVTEVIMSKTFTESIDPDREFVPIAGSDVDTSAVQLPPLASASAPSSAEQNQRELQAAAADSTAQSPLSAAASAHPVAEDAATATASSSGGPAAASSGDAGDSSATAVAGREGNEDGKIAVSAASEQARDLSAEFRRLQELLDGLSSPRHLAAAHDLEEDSSSSDENVVGDGTASGGKPREKTRVVYRYRIHEPPSQTGKRWISRHRDEEANDASGGVSANGAIPTAAETACPPDSINCAGDVTGTVDVGHADDSAEATVAVAETADIPAGADVIPECDVGSQLRHENAAECE